MKMKIEKCIIRNRRMLTVAATLFFAAAVFQITADKWPEGIIYFVAAAFFVSLEKRYRGKRNDTENNSETDEPDQEKYL